MDGKSWGIEGALVASRLVVLFPAIGSVLPRIASDATADVLAAQYAGDTIVTSLAGATRQVLVRIPMKNKTLASAVVDLAARHVKMVNCISGRCP